MSTARPKAAEDTCTSYWRLSTALWDTTWIPAASVNTGPAARACDARTAGIASASTSAAIAIRPLRPLVTKGVFGGAVPTPAGHGEVPGVEDEVVFVPQLTGQRVERLGVDLDDAPAPLAHDVGMGALAEVVHGRAVPEVSVLDDPEALEVVEDPINRRLVDVGLTSLHGGRQPLSRRMAVVLEEGGHQCPARRRDAAARGPQPLEDVVEPGCRRHRPIRRRRRVAPWRDAAR